ncbi:glucan endo-1,3-beta-glucosidase 5-like [Olea europaea subsp. europaea]|uniref:Glucan endo-1,3-beta-glucosidase 5-like n=1 Tax=Olea europaea subsp. europaea TaxID=158383 RepID=A0A8S0Q5K6_OLEEU|nr:glucan endo-1,3-beta-glucosidase 5-like [Olea europaea subsp. europaea]
MTFHCMFAFLFFVLGDHFLVDGLGCNWGTRATHPLPSNIVVKLMKDNGFNKVKLFEADPKALQALGRSGIQVMVGIPNDMLASLAGSVSVAEEWVSKNVSYYKSNRGVDISLTQSINFACTYADCTSLGNGSTCGGLDAKSNASYAFNMYYQTMNQRRGACDQFHGLSVITRIDPSPRSSSCKFEIMIDTGRHENATNPGTSSAGKMQNPSFFIAFMLALILCCVY